MACAVNADPISQLEEDLECTVCLEVLKDPRTLPCCHSFCKDCLEGVVQTCRDTAPHGQPIQEIPCPNCRATFPLDPDKHVADMPRNHFICNLVKVTAVLDRGIGVPCSHSCGNQSYSVARCVTCEKFLCRECLTDHNKYRGNNGHSVLTMEELSKPENRKKIKDKMYCNEHSDMILKIYCETCDQLICRDCMDFNHTKQGDSCFLVKDVANNYKELLASNNKVMEDAFTDGHVFVERLTLTSKQLDCNAKNIKKEIVEKKDAMLKTVAEMLEQKTKTLLNKVDEIHKGKQANLDKQTEETNQFVENIKTSVQLSKKLVEQGTQEEIISSQKMMLDNANNLLAKREEYFKASIPAANLKYTVCTNKKPIKEELLNALANFFAGEVSEKSVNEMKKTAANTKQNVKGNVREVSRVTAGAFSRLMEELASDEKSYEYTKENLFLPVLLTPFKEEVNKNLCETGNTFEEMDGWNECEKQDTDKMSAPEPKDVDKKECSICLGEITNRKTLDKCGHSFCADCVDRAFKHTKKCPLCSTVYGTLIGNQPEGYMFDSFRSTSLPGFKPCGTIIISYRFPSGVQGPNHPNPGKPYVGTDRNAYLPDNKEGRKVLKVLRKAFNQKLTFTIGRSATTGRNNCVIWSDIHHKTSMTGGPTCFGYPDPTYLKRVQEELAAKGITE